MTMFAEFVTPKGEEVCVNVSKIFYFCKKKQNITTLVLYNGYTLDVADSYEHIVLRMSRLTEESICLNGKS